MDRNTQITLERAKDAIDHAITIFSDMPADLPITDELDAALKGINGALSEVNQPKPEIKYERPTLPLGLPKKYVVIEHEPGTNGRCAACMWEIDPDGDRHGTLYQYASDTPDQALEKAMDALYDERVKLMQQVRAIDNRLGALDNLSMQMTLNPIIRKA